MPTSDTYKLWRDSTPVVPFPFTYKDKKDGVIRQTWKDIHSKLGRDAVNLALPFSTAHIVPSTVQQNCIADMIKSEQRVLRKVIMGGSSRANSAATATAAASVVSESGVSELSNEGAAGALSPLSGAVGPAGGGTPGSVSRLRRALYSAQERAALVSGEGGGRARRDFLKLRNQRPVAARYAMPRTTAQMYGWGFEDGEGNFPRPMQAKAETGDFRKKSCIKQMSRTTGVFERPELL